MQIAAGVGANDPTMYGQQPLTRLTITREQKVMLGYKYVCTYTQVIKIILCTLFVVDAYINVFDLFEFDLYTLYGSI